MEESELDKHEMVTLAWSDADLTVKATQEYLPHFDMGHYRYAIEDGDGNILSVGQSTTGCPKGKLAEVKLVEFLADFRRCRR